jgi:PAS domain S-box-containing protein
MPIQGVSSSFSVTRKLLVIVAIFAVIVLCLLELGALRAGILAGVRAYVGGEGLWSKAEKRAALSLVRYAASHSEADYRQYLAEISVPMGDREARLQLEQPNPNMTLVYHGFVQGRNSPDDVENMTKLFRRFGRIGYMKQAIEIWREGDGYIDQLRALATELHQQVNSGHPDAQKIGRLTEQVEATDADVTPLEDRFSSTLGLGARWIDRVLGWVNLSVTFILLFSGIGWSFVELRQLRTAEQERLKSAEVLRRSEERFRHLIQNLSDVIAVVTAEGKLLYHSPSLERVTGYSASDLEGVNLGDFVHPDDAEPVRAALTRAVQQPGTTIVPEFRFRRQDGAWIWLESVFKSVLDDAAVGGIVITSRDVTGRRTLQEQVQQSQKMEAVGRLAGGIAHDFNNLLMIIRGYAEVVLQQLDAGTAAHQSLQTIVQTTERAANLTRQLLSFSRKHVFNPQVLNLNLLVSNMGEMLRGLAGEEIEFVFKLEPGLGRISADAAQIEQVILNLAVNARDAMPKGGKLGLETSNFMASDEQSLTSSLVPAGTYVTLTVWDTGVGMDADTQSHIFEPFFSTKSKAVRSGLGLAVVYNIVAGSEGHVSVRSAPGRGTAFQVYFPRVEAAPEPESAPAETATAGPHYGGETIMVAEDQPELRLMVCHYLQKLGYSVLEAKDGAAAVAAAEQYQGSIELLLTDVVMPGLRGPEVAQRLSTTRPLMKVIYMSGYTEGAFDTASGEEERHWPAATLLQKPFRLDTLAATVRQVLDDLTSPS